MVKNMARIKSILFPNKKINFIVLFLFLLGIICGTIFLCILNANEKNYIITKITSFFAAINGSKLDYGNLYLNSIFINILYILLCFLLGLTVFGIVFIVGLVFFKGFILGFYLGAFVLTYSYKGIIISFLYTITVQLLNIFSVISMSIMGIICSFMLLKMILNKTSYNYKRFFRNYFLVFLLLIIISLVSSLFEVFVFPSLIKLIIKLFV